MKPLSRFLLAAVSFGALAGSLASASATMVLVPVDITTGTGSSATQSTGYNGDSFPANRALDGNVGNFTHTAVGDANPSWTGNFGREETINQILVYNRGDGCCPERLSDITVTARDGGGATVFTSAVLNPGNALGGPRVLTVDLGAPTAVQEISVARDGASAIGSQGVLSLGEVLVGSLLDVQLPLGTDLTRAGIVGMTTAQSPTSGSPPGGGVPGNGVDGNLGNFTHTNANLDTDHMWQVDFGEVMLLQTVELFNRSNCCGERLRDITVSVLDGGGASIFESDLLNPGNELGYTGTNQGGLFVDLAALNGGSPIAGKTVVVTRTPDDVGPNNDDRSVLSLGEVTVIGGTIPEPSVPGLIGLAGLLALCRRRRR